MKVILNISKTIVLIALVIVLIATIMLQIITSTALDKDYILGKLDETNYYNNLYNEVESNFENYIYQSGLDEDVIKNLVTEEEVKQDTIQIINNLYGDKVINIDVSKIENRLQQNIDKSLEGQNVSSSTKNSIKQFIDQITKEYKNTIVHTKYEDNINQTITKVKKYAESLKIALLVGDVVLILALLLLSIKDIQRGFAKLGIAILSTGIFAIAINVIVNWNVKIDYITAISTGFSMSLREILHNIMNTVNTYGIIFAIVGVIIILASNIILYKNKED